MTTCLEFEFDAVAKNYEEQLNLGIQWSGESADYFVARRIQVVATFLAARGFVPKTVLDFGCGVGNAIPELFNTFHPKRLVGLDPSRLSLDFAQRTSSNLSVDWTHDGSSISSSSIDLVYTSGVFHHIPPEDRNEELSKIHRWLRPGAILAFFENNPWNLGTRWVMSRIPFDRDAQCLSPIAARGLLRNCGFDIVETRYLFFFPRFLRMLRGLENHLGSFPLGAQYLVIARRLPALAG